jgi:tetratricopeptide (TPR) repeat protein
VSAPTVFISYSHKDEIWKDRLRPHLGLLEKDGRLTVWDDRGIDGGATWYDEIKRVMEDAEVAVCLISADYLNSDFCVKEEIPYLLERRKQEGMLLLPVLIRPCLWTSLDWLKALQMLPRDGKSVAVDFKDDWDTPFVLVADSVLTYLSNKSKREVLLPPAPPRWSEPEKVDIARLPVTGAELFGRQNELKLLDEIWESHSLNVVSLVAWGGVGKSTLVGKWCERLAADNYRGARRVFAWSFYSQGTSERVTSADLFIAEALKWFGDPDPAQGSPWDKGGRLADLIRQEKTLLLLDGMEPLQSSLDFERGKVHDPALATLLTELARENPGLCVITTREKVADLEPFQDRTRHLDVEQISAEAGRALLRVGGVAGTDAELEDAARGFGLHAFALKLLAAYLSGVPGHHISNAAQIPDLDVPLEKGKHPRRVMAAFAERFGESSELDILRMLGLFNSPAPKEALDAVRAAPPIPGLTEHLQNISDVDWLKVVNRLRRLKLIAPESRHRGEALDAHPLVREHFGAELKENYPNAWREGNNRLYEYYKSIAKEYPDTLQEMAPLFAAVTHGCQAGKHQEALFEVYWKRIQRGNESFNTKRLGAISSEIAALAGFFDPPWYKPVDGLSEAYKGFVLNEAGYDLRALGRLAEAAEPMQASLKIGINRESWKGAARSASNLSELYLTLGDLPQALVYAEQCVELADSSGDAFTRTVTRTKVGDVLHQTGRLIEAAAAFREAENLQKEDQPEFPLLYSLRGYQYCALLLTQGDYAEVQKRVNIIFEWRKGSIWNPAYDSHLAIALDNLSLGLAGLLQAQHDSNYSITNSLGYLNRAVDGLRQAGTMDHLPRSLLARAEYYRLTEAFERAKRDLDEAFTIAARGGMGLYLADCHLEYVRLYMSLRGRSPKQFPRNQEIATSQNALLAMTDEQLKEKAKEHWGTAKDMIEKTGYHRRDKEVQELEGQLMSL